MHALAHEHLGIALVDDDETFREIICANLADKSSFMLFEAASGDQLIELLDREHIDCIVLDYDLGSETGLGVKQRVDELVGKRVPVIMMTGDGRQNTSIRAFRMGVADYLPKHGLRPEILIQTVCDVVGRHRQEQISDAERLRLIAASTTDAATGLESRARLDERLALLAGLAPVARAQFGVILVEMVGYKAIVERFGFKVADQALRTIGRKLPDFTRSSDVCGRYENGVFLVIADVQGDGDLLATICRRIAANLAARLTSDAAELKLSVRVAGALTSPDPAGPSGPVDHRSILRRAEAALARAEMSGETVVLASGVVPFATAQPGRPVPAGPQAIVAEPANRPAAEELRSENRRRHVRQRVLKRGLIHITGMLSTINCTVRNMSPGGAGLRLEAPCSIPEMFDLEVVGSGTRQRVGVRWQIGSDLGVEYLPVR